MDAKALLCELKIDPIEKEFLREIQHPEYPILYKRPHVNAHPDIETEEQDRHSDVKDYAAEE